MWPIAQFFFNPKDHLIKKGYLSADWTKLNEVTIHEMAPK